MRSPIRRTARREEVPKTTDAEEASEAVVALVFGFEGYGRGFMGVFDNCHFGCDATGGGRVGLGWRVGGVVVEDFEVDVWGLYVKRGEDALGFCRGTSKLTGERVEKASALTLLSFSRGWRDYPEDRVLT